MSKQLAFMIVATLVGVGGSLAASPFYGVAAYYLFAVLRPQFIWKWSLPADVSWSFYVAVAAILGLALSARPATTSPGVNPKGSLTAAHWTVLVFGGWVAATYFTARNQEAAYPYFIEYLKLFVMFWVAARVIQTPRQVWTLYLLAAGILGYIAYEINWFYFFNNRFTYIYKLGYGGLDNNGAGLMLAMGVPLCYFAFEGIRNWYRWAFVALIPLIVHAVLTSYSRGAMVSLIASIPYFLLRSRKRIQLAGLLVAMSLLVPAFAGNEIRARFFTLENTEVDESANSRRQSWAAAWRIAEENPVFGVGIRNSNLIAKEYGADMEGRTIHSQYLQTAADSGLVALGLYLTALAAFWLSVRRARIAAKKRTDLDGWRAYAAASGVEGAMLVFCVGSAFLSLENFELPYLMLLLGAQLPVVLQLPSDTETALDSSQSTLAGGL